MSSYKLYFLDDRSHVVRAVDLVCDTDEEATALAEEHRKGAPAEVWHGARVVADLPRRQDP